MLAVGLLDPLPDAPPVRTHVRQQDVSVLPFVQPLDFDRLPFAELNWLAGIDEFLRWHQPFELSSHVHNHARIRNRQHAPVENLPFRRRFRRRELVEQLVHRLGCFGGFRLGSRCCRSSLDGRSLRLSARRGRRARIGVRRNRRYFSRSRFDRLVRACHGRGGACRCGCRGQIVSRSFARRSVDSRRL